MGIHFFFHEPKNMKEAELFGLGIGLYWGEGTKANKNTVRLGNSDPNLLNKFIEFLVKIYGVDKESLKFELQIFNNVPTEEAEKYWTKELDIKKKQLYKTRVTPSRGEGSYRKKNCYGVMTVYYGNTKLRNRLVEILPR